MKDQIRECVHCGVSKGWPQQFSDPEALRCDRCPAPQPGVGCESRLPVPDAARALVDKLREIHDSAEYQAVWTLYAAHGGRYAGPKYEAELAALEDALRAAGHR